MAALFPMQWPQEVENFFAVQSAISSASQALLSPTASCRMSPLESVYRKQVGFALLPFTIVLCCTLVWRAARVAKCKCGWQTQEQERPTVSLPPLSFYTDRAVLSWVGLLYLFYPTAVKQALAMLACERVGAEGLWLGADLQEPCLEGRHAVLLVVLCLPQLLLHVVGLPLGAFVILFRNRNRLFAEDVQFRWGLLYAGYRHDVFWWELTIVIRKVALVVVGGVFGSRLGPDMQVYMALAMVVFFIIIHLAWRPFDELTASHKILHWLELGSLMVCWGTPLTVGCCSGSGKLAPGVSRVCFRLHCGRKCALHLPRPLCVRSSICSRLVQTGRSDGTGVEIDPAHAESSWPALGTIASTLFRQCTGAEPRLGRPEWNDQGVAPIQRQSGTAIETGTGKCAEIRKKQRSNEKASRKEARAGDDEVEIATDKAGIKKRQKPCAGERRQCKRHRRRIACPGKRMRIGYGGGEQELLGAPVHSQIGTPL